MSTQKQRADILENEITENVLSMLLKDQTTGENILWATSDYDNLGCEYRADRPILVDLITGAHGKVIKPRVKKTKKQQAQRSRTKAEVFTPLWVCNAQNNLVDRAWFGRFGGKFNREVERGWETYYRKVYFPDNPGKGWQDYVKAVRLEIACGEAPYLTSRYDPLTGFYVPVKNRIGLLDRKLRVVTENTDSPEAWQAWAEEALKSIYGFEMQGDSVLLARENVLYAVLEAFHEHFNTTVDEAVVLHYAEIISWNIWQMDGIKMVVPGSCHDVPDAQGSIFEPKMLPCPGCRSGDNHKHNGIYANIMDWEAGAPVRFINLTEGGMNDAGV